MDDTPSPLTWLLTRPGFRPFSGPRAFMVLERAKARLNLDQLNMEDLLKAVSSLGTLTESEAALVYALQDQMCVRCGACCRDNAPLKVSKQELEALAAHTGESYKKLKRRVRATPKGDGTFRVSRRPCPFLEGSLCGVHQRRPAACRGYPAEGVLAALGEGKPLPDLCPISDELLAEIVVKRALEEKMHRESPELLEEFAERRRKDAARLRGLSPAQRLRALTERYRSSLQRSQG